MAKIKSSERVLEYAKEFKVSVVQLTEQLDVQASDIARVLNLHPMMVYRWRQEFREGKLVVGSTRRVNMTLDKTSPPPPTKKQLSENERLRKEVAQLKKENDLLKKWQGYLTEVRQKDSDS